MKKSVLALAVTAAVFAANSVCAVPVYEKDGNKLNLNGRIQAVYFSNAWNKAGNKDSSLTNSVRFGFDGRVKLNDYVTGYAYTQWDMSDSNGQDRNNSVRIRDQYVGFDFGEYGKLQAGRYKGELYYVGVIDDWWDDTMADNANFQERRAGLITYTYEGHGFHASVTGQTAMDSVSFDGAGTVNLDTGVGVSLGYKTPAFGLGPLSIRAAYEYQKFQDDNGHTSSKDFKTPDSITYSGVMDDVNGYGLGLIWGPGNRNPGLTLGAEYSVRDFGVKSNTDENLDYKSNNFALFVSYTFDYAVTLSTGYEWTQFDPDNSKIKSAEYASVPVYLNWNIVPSFNVWGEAIFRVDDDYKTDTNAGYSRTKFNGKDDSFFALGARYSF
ncbi:MAG: porin [Succinivibrio sp.]|nr:porin [Succinivibrio sp.]